MLRLHNMWPQRKRAGQFEAIRWPMLYHFPTIERGWCAWEIDAETGAHIPLSKGGDWLWVEWGDCYLGLWVAAVIVRSGRQTDAVSLRLSDRITPRNAASVAVVGRHSLRAGAGSRLIHHCDITPAPTLISVIAARLHNGQTAKAATWKPTSIQTAAGYTLRDTMTTLGKEKSQH